MRVKLGEVCDVRDGTHDSPSYVETGYPLVTSKNIVDGNLDLSVVNYIEKQDYEKINERSKVDCGDIIMPMIGTIGNPFIVGDYNEFAIKNVALIKFPKDNILNKYVFYYLQSGAFERYVKAKNKGGPQKFLSLGDIRNIEIELLSLDEQENIVTIFDKVTELIALRKQQLSKLDELVKARFVELFGDKGYPEDTLLNLCNIIDYRGKTPEKVESGLPFITAKNVRMHQMNLEPREYISKETYDKVMIRGFPKEGDVVFTTEAPLGNVCRIPHFDTEFYIGQRIVTLQTEKLEPIYLEYALSSDDFKTKYMGKSSGSTVTGIRVRLLEQLTIPVPPMELQEQFAAFVEQTEKSKLAIQQSLDKLELLKKSLMQEYFG